MSWTDSQIESLITFYSSVLVSGARNLATGVKKPSPETDDSFLAPVSGACLMGIRLHLPLLLLSHTVYLSTRFQRFIYYNT